MFSVGANGAGALLPTLMTLLGTFLVSANRTPNTATYPSLIGNGNATLPGLLYPRESESRQVVSLNGMWDFLVSPPADPEVGYREGWYEKDLNKVGKPMKMPVPSSYNDVTTSSALRDHVGVVWYQRTFYTPSSWAEMRTFVWFGSVNYIAHVWINGKLVASHELGHLPFEGDIGGVLNPTGKNYITVAIDNRLLINTVPQGRINKINTDEGEVFQQTYTFDFFHYSGIHRSVFLYTKPRVHVSDISVKTSIDGNDGTVEYVVEARGLDQGEIPNFTVSLIDADGLVVAKESGKVISGRLKVPSANLWWGRDMGYEPGYLYTLEVRVSVTNTSGQDVYRLPVGIRTVTWTNTSLLLNGKPVYFRGFGRHEDSFIRGRALDLPTMTRDYELLKWVGANGYRTSHYPYSEEVLDEADRQGFLIIDECPAVNTENFSTPLLELHKRSLSELIRRDKNRPSVVMWSIANEPFSQYDAASDYFRQIAEHTRSLDLTRPITLAIAQSVQADKSAPYLDIISFNRYNAWYSNPGRLDVIDILVEAEATAWNEKYNKPVMMTEYGADTMPGLHELPAYVWSEDYQTELMSRHFKAFDRLRKKGFFIGEFIWNFADFRTAQSFTRVGGNKKGIFTRDRQPKEVAHLVRKRYFSLAAEQYNVLIPKDLALYVSSTYAGRSEL
ncbi:beta-glucuronidase isoform X2 [Neodiprion virginianus]|uniref:beta-glucuronidase isoform X2 n=1 Tax=Neodiprion virginianus TaxID=2961670 RepID=UPI001EE6AB5A|nr:beta-glucuronidase isoform X2 [Neodiprion virginianus]